MRKILFLSLLLASSLSASAQYSIYIHTKSGNEVRIAPYDLKDIYFYSGGDEQNTAPLSGQTIYEQIKQSGPFQTLLRLIDDTGYKGLLSGTDDKTQTLFAANDEAFNAFFQHNRWGVTSYDNLTTNQKYFLMRSALMGASLGEGTKAQSLQTMAYNIDKYDYIRRPSFLKSTDGVMFLSWDSPYIPTTFNQGLHNNNGKPDTDYWAHFRSQAKGGITLAQDATEPMITFFNRWNLADKNITDEDFRIIMGRERQQNDTYIYNARVIQGDIICSNGIVHQIDQVMIIPSNMAEEIRTNGRTTLFSHLLDRFSAPYYNETLTRAYQQQNPAIDSVFEMRYLSYRSKSEQNITDPVGNRVSCYLNYDPGWNTYNNGSVKTDMGAMFVPSDAAMERYLLRGAGRYLMDSYATEKPVTIDNLKKKYRSDPFDCYSGAD